ncbi:baculoviral IAP repeat-containing protein 7-like [Haliotis rubra]|uniref:baculoviral IAP repeat-containing protein 7-like n=1 Tax=Haliotis rubra TaxID=36100 RepID=UPI001EE50E8B|nr:baculoviral IAP repeat-containing protein 7-like [Haliotis rubra]
MAGLYVVIVSCVYLAVASLPTNNPKHGAQEGLQRCSSFFEESGHSHRGNMVLCELGHGCANVKVTTSGRTKNRCVPWILLLIVVLGILQLYFSIRLEDIMLKRVDDNVDDGHCVHITSLFKSVKFAHKSKMGLIRERNELKTSLSNIDGNRPSKEQFITRTVVKYFDSRSEKIDKVLSGMFEIQPEYLSVPEVVAQPFTTSLTTYLGKVQEAGQVPVEEEMCYEVRRLQSFSGIPVQASPMRLAQSGFYATGREDEARCYSCRKSHTGWQIMDRPDVLHRVISPDCPHLNRGDPRNIPLTSNSNATTVYGILGEYSGSSNVTTTDTLPPTATETPTLGAAAAAAEVATVVSEPSLDMNSAVHPHYRDMQTRLDSFRGWDTSHVQDPRVLATAGFFYAGYSDCVRCFYCGVGLKTWEERDDPFVEHVRWRSSCSYIRRLKGENFVIQALTHKTSPSSTVTNNMTVVARAVEMGFSRQMVEKAVMEMSRSYNNSRAAGETDQIPVSLEALLERLVIASEEPGERHRNPEIPQQRHQVSEVHQSLPARLTTPSNSTTANQPSSVKNPTSSSTRHPHEAGKSMSGTETSRSLPRSLQRQLEEENRALRDENTCKVCLDRTSCVVFLPCGHLVSCAECAPALSKCPICRAHIRGTVRTYNA